MSNLLAIKAQAERELASWRRHIDPLLENTLGCDRAEAAKAELASELWRVLELMPDPGWQAPQMRAFGLGGAIYLAVFLVLHRRGQSAEKVWQLCEQATRSRFSSMSALSRKLMGWMMFSPLWKLLTKRIAAQSARAAVGGWMVDYLPGESGSFDYGVTYRRCAIRDAAHAVGAADFAPYICQSDAVMSELLGWGLRRTQTIAQGGSACDFRFRKGGPTEVRPPGKLPVVS